MIKNVILLLIFFTTSLILGSCQSSGWTNVQVSSFYSASRDRMIKFAIYTPPGYKSDDQHYPVLYFLHGSGSDYFMYWAQISESVPEANGDAGAWLNQLITEGMIPPMIIVTPDDTDGSWGETNEAMVTQELIAHIDSNWRTIPDRSGRAIEGFSMGAMGASRYAALYPDLFCSTIIMSMPGRENQISFWQDNREEILADQLMTRLNIGEADRRHGFMVQFHNDLLAIEIPHEFETYPDIDHVFGPLYNQSGIEGLQFHANCFEKVNSSTYFGNVVYLSDIQLKVLSK